MQKNVGKCLMDNWVEERAVAALADHASRDHAQRDGLMGVFSRNLETKMEDISTLKAAYTPPVGPGVRERGIRGELFEKFITQRISEKVQAELSPETPAADLSSTTHRDFTGGGFVPLPPEPATDRDYRRDPAVTFWSENRQHIQRTTAGRAAGGTFGAFKRSALFSTPVTQRLDDP